MNTNNNKANGTNAAAVVEAKVEVAANVAESAVETTAVVAANVATKETVAAVEVAVAAESALEGEAEALNSKAMEAAIGRPKEANKIRRGEILLAKECEGNLSAFKKALKDGLLVRPEGLEAVSFHCTGFAKRDEGLVARQFTLTLKVNGKWAPLSRYAASAEGGRFAMGASQTLKGAKQLAQLLTAVWLKGMKFEKKGKKTTK